MLIFEYCVHYVNEHSLDTIGTKFDKSLCLASSESIYGYVELISFLEIKLGIITENRSKILNLMKLKNMSKRPTVTTKTL